MKEKRDKVAGTLTKPAPEQLKVIDLSVWRMENKLRREAWTVHQLICSVCLRYWIQSAPGDADPYGLKCPSCHQRRSIPVWEPAPKRKKR